ncbi:glycoside hydrolase family 43 protein [Proteiniphilum sp.]|uniref:glycoside hydrolase family 43 protein n=1 Tax=Proteiniphilum sp. TaxID=1926877 RepID=UPI002B21FEFA|nr:glycoside hydrolase family 43 protein [Proteiniphilum sp.]MEA4917858.1 glycoside hydrolase family 43 protein [Proteiniphilum sp.]
MKIYNFSLLFLIVQIFFSCTGKDSQPVFTMQLKTNDGEYVALGDPFVYKHNGTYYMTGTSNPDSGFDYYTSNDLATWEYKGALFRPSENHFGKGFFWAPEVKFYQGKFFLTYSSLDKKSGLLLSALAVSDKPEGPFRELYAPWFNIGKSAIDCHIFVDDDQDQTSYLFFSQNGAEEGYSYGKNYVVRLTKDLSKFEGEPVLVGEASQEWEKVNYATNRCNEGVFVLKHDGNYYMTYSANHTSYSHYGVGTARAKHPLGPWIKDKDNPILFTDTKLGISSPGHSSIVESVDGRELHIVYHAHRNFDAPQPNDDRIAYIGRLYFNEAGNLRVKKNNIKN